MMRAQRRVEKKCILALIDIILAVKQKSDNLVGFQALVLAR